ncbi:hypothetical protein P355_3570 [Burkholderia cenocepacia KC-01]|nr:hypothetical protein P355_3570 [Burkholderia cenocepacia KC-01]
MTWLFSNHAFHFNDCRNASVVFILIAEIQYPIFKEICRIALHPTESNSIFDGGFSFFKWRIHSGESKWKKC